MRPVLIHLEDRRELPAVWCTAVRVDGDGKATLAVDEPYDPVRIELERISVSC
jgi:hypothetical protein